MDWCLSVLKLYIFWGFSEWMPWKISALFLVYKSIFLTLKTSITIALESIKRHNLQHMRSWILMHMLDYKRVIKTFISE